MTGSKKVREYAAIRQPLETESSMMSINFFSAGFMDNLILRHSGQINAQYIKGSD
tara:strand:- start:3290 stop:3454 length:165 start_codon:yes stop_codon:yes gene_type:complete